MEDKTPIYIMMIVGIVAVVGVVFMLTNSANTGVPTTSGASGITANVVAEESAPVDLGAISRTLMGVILIGICVYLYRKV